LTPTFATLFVLALPLAAAAETRADLDRHKDFSRYKTFILDVKPPTRADGEVDEHNALAENRMRQAVTRAAWMDFINTANSRGTLARFFLEKNDVGHYHITLHAHVTGAYERRAVAPAMDMWNDDLLLLRDRPAMANEINGSADTAIAGALVH
jgi:hypothetical protein